MQFLFYLFVGFFGKYKVQGMGLKQQTWYVFKVDGTWKLKKNLFNLVYN